MEGAAVALGGVVLTAAGSPDTAVGAVSAPQPVSSVAISIAAPVGDSDRIVRVSTSEMSRSWDRLYAAPINYRSSVASWQTTPRDGAS
jgi:hypothetical protein